MHSTFSALGLPPVVVDALASNGIDAPFPIQAEAIPAALEGRDVCGRAPTGSGKTLAFGLPMLMRVGVSEPRRPRALILSPTRELAAQIRSELAPFAKAAGRQAFAVYGGVRYQAQKDWLNRGVDVLVATPGRLEDLIDQGAVSLEDVSIVAVDEADRMADMGFLPTVRRILDQTSSDRQTLLFSATLDGDVGVLIRRYQDDPVRVEAGSVETDALDATHLFWSIDHKEKVEVAAQVVGATGSAIVFTRTRHGADRLAKQMSRHGVSAIALHGGRSQNQRNRALDQFKQGTVDALVATDVAARGIHVDGVASVVHFDPPNGHKDYLHRSGRTARAGMSGIVVSLVTPGEHRAAVRMQRNLDIHAPIGEPRIHELYATGHTPAVSKKPAGAKLDRGDAPKPARRAKSGQPKLKGHREVVVSNLPWATTDREIHTIFAKHGSVHTASVKKDRRGRSKGVAIIAMHPRGAEKAIKALNGRRIGGREIAVRLGEHRS